MEIPKPSRIRDAENLAVARLLPCAACGAPPPGDPAHVRSRGAGGSDRVHNVMPLCRPHHRMQHDCGWDRMGRWFRGVAQWLDDHDWVFEKNGKLWHPEENHDRPAEDAG